MQKLFLALGMVLLLAGSAAAHGSISKLPDSVQILQYNMKLYMNADDADTKNKLAMVYVRTGKLTEAKEQLTSILAKDPHNFNALDEMGVVLLIEGNSTDALEYLSKAQDINDKDLMLHVHLSIAHGQLHQEDLARQEMEKARALSSGPEDATEIEKEITMITTPQKGGETE